MGYLESAPGSEETLNLGRQSSMALYLQPAMPSHLAWAGGLLRTRQLKRDTVRCQTGQTGSSQPDPVALTTWEELGTPDTDSSKQLNCATWLRLTVALRPKWAFIMPL